MPKRKDIKSILIVGAGPIVIGQGCEFDYSGTQACKALREEGYKVILINSNPATIMTDPETADKVYIEPITPEIVEKIIAKERPDVMLPTMGGQTALNIAIALSENGVLKKYKVDLIGANLKAIKKAEERESFYKAMKKIGLDVPEAHVARSYVQAQKVLKKLGLPVIIRPSFTLGGTGGGIAKTKEEFDEITKSGLYSSPINEILVEESVAGWKEFEMEVVRDKNDNCIIVCSIENIDPMGIHTGDSITVAPALTLTDKEYQDMRNASIACLREIGVETGGSNVQFAVNPKNGRLVIIEMNPRVSRSSALASKATGFPIAKIAAKLAVGYTLDELHNEITKVTPASFEPTIDYVVTKIPRFTFEKFQLTKPLLTSSMKSVGEAMAIGRSFPESLQKALRSLETGLSGLDEVKITNEKKLLTKDNILNELKKPTSDRILKVAQALRFNKTIKEIHKACKIDPWFIEQIGLIVTAEKDIKLKGIPTKGLELQKIKSLGFSDKKLSELSGVATAKITERRNKLNIAPNFKRIDTCAGEFKSLTPYMYSTYHKYELNNNGCESSPSSKKKVIILGSGPNRIGQGIEFDYCCCHASFALKKMNYETIMINCNPETVSTDPDTSDRLYFEPLTSEDVYEIIKREKTNGKLVGVIVQFGGQTPLKLAEFLNEMKIPILGTSVDSIDLAEDRARFKQVVDDLNLLQPINGIAYSEKQAFEIIKRIGFPAVIRPSYVLGGRAMEIVHKIDELKKYFKEAVVVSGDSPVLIDSYLKDSIEVDVDAISDGKDVLISGIMEHIEEAGIHSGDSTCTLPPYSLSEKIIENIKKQTHKLAIALKVKGLLNIQFAVQNNNIFLLEVNPRSSRTVPFVAKATGLQIVQIASKISVGKKLKDLKIKLKKMSYIAIKEPVFPFKRFPNVDTILGPEMKSTGEVMSIDKDFESAFIKCQMAASNPLPIKGKLFVSVKDSDKAKILPTVRSFAKQGFQIIATSGTASFLKEGGVKVSFVNKVTEGHPHIVDLLEEDKISIVINTTETRKSINDSFSLRRTALNRNVPYFLTVSGARAAINSIKRLKSGNNLIVRPISEYH
jgi:carbamoyl-phosphate synthase large subunit